MQLRVQFLGSVVLIDSNSLFWISVTFERALITITAVHERREIGINYRNLSFLI